MRVAVSGYFNPLHIGHLAYFKEAATYGNLIVIVNNDLQVIAKGSEPFMDENERLEIIKAITYVDEAVLSIDTDTTVRETLRMLKPDIFANGGDRKYDVPEKDVCVELGIRMLFDIGGSKIQSSSRLKERMKDV